MGITHFIKTNILEPTLGFLDNFIILNRPNASKEKWAETAQKGEFDFHKVNQWRNSPKFMEDTIMLFDSFGYTRDQFIGKSILDLGAGSKLRSRYFNAADWIVIEPMADKCIEEIPWCDLQDAKLVFSIPAEEFLPELVDQVDFIFSINVLDHCYNFNQIVSNLYKYLNKEGTAFLSFDAHFITDSMHPLILTDKICTEIFENIGFKINKKNKGFFGKYKESKNVVTYGHGRYCLNYWLSK